MKKIVFTLIILAININIALAQSPEVKKAAKSVFTLTTYKTDGTIKATSHGVYFGEKGEGISSFTPFIGASTASIIDASGKKSDVTAIVGANEMYDICRFQVSNNNTTPLIGVSQAADGKVWSIGFSTKKPEIRQLNIASKESFLDKYTYYIFKEEIGEDEEGCPILTDAGQLVGLVQRSSSSYIINTTDANYYLQLRSSGFASQDRYLQKTGIRSAVPDDLEQAKLLLLMIDANTDSVNVVNTVNAFNEKFANQIDGYQTLARYNVAHMNLNEASDIMEQALKKCDDKAEVYSQYSELVYNRATYLPDSAANWTFGHAEELINKAIEIKSTPGYRHQLAQILFAEGEIDKAYSIFEELSSTELQGSEVYYEMAQCKARLQAPDEEVLQNLDKAVECCKSTYNTGNASYVLARGSWLDKMGRYKPSLIDYNLYDSIMGKNASADFYYTRYQCELKMRQYQIALNDIAHAAYLQPGQIGYLAELASLDLRVRRYEDALHVCDLAMNIAKDDADIYVIQGVALAQLGRKEEAKQSLLKAKELGDERGDQYIEKYCK